MPTMPRKCGSLAGKRAEPHQGQGARRIDQPHEFGEPGAGLRAGIDQPAAAVEQRLFRRRDQLDRLGDARRVGRCLRPVGLVPRLLGRGVSPQREQHVFRQIDDDRAGPPALRDIKRLVQNAREIGDILDQIIVLGAGPGDAGRVGFLKRVVADQMGRHLPGQADDRDQIHQRVGQPGHRVGRAGAAGHQHDADLAGRARIAFGGVHRAALLAHQDVAQRVLLEQRVVDRQDRAAGIAEYDFDALIDERLDDDIRSADRLGRHDALRQEVPLEEWQIPPGGPPRGGPGERHPSQLASAGQQELVNKMTGAAQQTFRILLIEDQIRPPSGGETTSSGASRNAGSRAAPARSLRRAGCRRADGAAVPARRPPSSPADPATRPRAANAAASSSAPAAIIAAKRASQAA